MNTDLSALNMKILRSWIRRLAITLPLLLMLGGCIALNSRQSPAQPVAGVDRYQLSELTGQSPSGCEFSYRLYQPDAARTDTYVIVGHGFLRKQDRHVDLAKALANQGVPVATLNFCNMKPWNGHHERNAKDMQYVAAQLGKEDNVILAGFSAGALAALLAATETTRAVITLDLVDQGTLAIDAVRALPHVPLLGLYGPPSACNANNNALPVFEEKRNHEPANPPVSVSQLIAKASHCEFESPSNWLCEFTCGDDDREIENAQTRQAIIQSVLELVQAHVNPINPGKDESLVPPS